MASRQLLGDSAPPGDAKDIGSHVPKVVQHLDGQVGDARQPVRKSRQWRMTYAGDVKCDDLPIGHPARNGFEQLDIAPDSVEEQERYPGSLSGLPTHTQCLTAKLQHLRCEAAFAVRQVRADTVIARRVHSPRPSIITDVAVVLCIGSSSNAGTACPGHGRLRSSRLKILPTVDFGKASMKRTILGTL